MRVDRRGACVVVARRGSKAIAAAAPGHVVAVRRLFVDRLTPSQLARSAMPADTVLTALDEPVEPDARASHKEVS